MGFGNGMTIGWPMASSANNSVYKFIIKDCNDSLRMVYSTSSQFLPTIYVFRNRKLTIPFTNGGNWNLPELINTIGGYGISNSGQVKEGLKNC